MLRAARLTLAVAESCTGGLLAHHITNVPGSSNYFLGGVIAYSNEVKVRLLGVPVETIEQHSAVSWQTALAMARGVRQRLGADVALSITGIAGPTGGTPEKPVGLVYLGLAADDAERWEEHRWSGTRLENKEFSVRAALIMLLAYLEKRFS
ncbi:MAG: CinA family protein [Chloroflexi bacterium]|nr:CinA family protein [Chloroflexota bacterium]